MKDFAAAEILGQWREKWLDPAPRSGEALGSGGHMAERAVQSTWGQWLRLRKASFRIKSVSLFPSVTCIYVLLVF